MLAPLRLVAPPVTFRIASLATPLSVLVPVAPTVPVKVPPVRAALLRLTTPPPDWFQLPVLVLVPVNVVLPSVTLSAALFVTPLSVLAPVAPTVPVNVPPVRAAPFRLSTPPAWLQVPVFVLVPARVVAPPVTLKL